MRDKGKELIDLASSEFSDLTQAELNLLQAVATDEFAWRGPSRDPENKDNNPESADGWPKDREIRATLIGWLCVDQDASGLIGPKGLFVFGARITGALDLSFATVAFPLHFKKCRFTEPLKLQFAEMKFLEFSGTVSREINADGIVVHGGIHLRHGFVAHGEVRLVAACVGGNLDCSGGTFMKGLGDSSALCADGARVKGAVVFRDGFRADGEVHIVGADIGMDLDCKCREVRKP